MKKTTIVLAVLAVCMTASAATADIVGTVRFKDFDTNNNNNGDGNIYVGPNVGDPGAPRDEAHFGKWGSQSDFAISFDSDTSTMTATVDTNGHTYGASHVLSNAGGFENFKGFIDLYMGDNANFVGSVTLENLVLNGDLLDAGPFTVDASSYSITFDGLDLSGDFLLTGDLLLTGDSKGEHSKVNFGFGFDPSRSLVPEPATMAIWASLCGAGALAGIRRKRRV